VEIPRTTQPIPWIAAVLLALALAGIAFVHFREKPAETEQFRLQILAPGSQQFPVRERLAISADGSKVLFLAANAAGKNQLWVRRLDTLEAQPVEGAENADDACWSPDGRSMAWFANGKLITAELEGAARRTIAEAPDPRGCAWISKETILFTPSNASPVYRVNPVAGAPVAVTKISPSESHRFPSVLPDGRHFLYAVTKGNQATEIRVGSLDSPEQSQALAQTDSFAVWSSGFLLYLRGSTLVARPFDDKRNALEGEETVVAKRIDRTLSLFGSGTFAASQNGRLVYRGAGFNDRLGVTWFDRSGRRVGTSGDPGPVLSLQLSPEGSRALLSLAGASGEPYLAIQDLQRGTRSHLTRTAKDEAVGAWSPDGRTIAFLRGTQVLRVRADGSGEEELLTDDHHQDSPYSFSPDGKFLALWSASMPGTGNDIRLLSDPLGPAGKSTIVPLVNTRFSESEPQISPDGKWIAYSSNELGTREIFIAPFRSSGGAHQISTAGGRYARWRRDSKELFWVDLSGRIVSSAISVNNGIPSGSSPQPLFILPPAIGVHTLYDVSADGKRFLAAVPPEDAAIEPLSVVQNWSVGVKR
jgi:Tol biopolymer transport system component